MPRVFWWRCEETMPCVQAHLHAFDAFTADIKQAAAWPTTGPCGCKYKIWRYAFDREMKPGRR